MLDQRPDFIFQHVLGRAGDDEVIRITNEVDFEPVLLGSVAPPAKGYFQELLQSVQGHVRQRRRDDAALRRACLRGEQALIFDVAGFQPTTQNFRVRGNLVQDPFVAEVVEAAANDRARMVHALADAGFHAACEVFNVDADTKAYWTWLVDHCQHGAADIQENVSVDLFWRELINAWHPSKRKSGHRQKFNGKGMSCWGVKVDLHPLGLIAISDQEFDESLVEDAELNTLSTADNWMDVRKGDLFALIMSVLAKSGEEDN